MTTASKADAAKAWEVFTEKVNAAKAADAASAKAQWRLAAAALTAFTAAGGVIGPGKRGAIHQARRS